MLSFAVALLWLIALATYNPADPAWFFNTGAAQARHEPRRGAPGRSSRSCRSRLLGYAAYLFPVLAAVVGWYRFWCTPIDALYTKIVGVVAAASPATASFLALALAAARARVAPSNPADGSGDQLAGALDGVVQPHRLAHHHPDGPRSSA